MTMLNQNLNCSSNQTKDILHNLLSGSHDETHDVQLIVKVKTLIKCTVLLE